MDQPAAADEVTRLYRIHGMDLIDGAGSRGASVSTLQALSRHWSAVFVSCARPIVGVWQPMQLAAQPGFLARHASQVRQLDQLAWQLLGHQPR
jgi:hypothetical protein